MMLRKVFTNTNINKKNKKLLKFYSTYDPNMRKNILKFIHSLFEYKKDKKYQEDLSLVDHSLQVATLAEKNGSSSRYKITLKKKN